MFVLIENYYQRVTSGRETGHKVIFPPKFQIFLIAPDFIKSLISSLKMFSSSYTKFIRLDIKFRFTCNESHDYDQKFLKLFILHSVILVMFKVFGKVLVWLRKVSSNKKSTEKQSWKLSKVKFLPKPNMWNSVYTEPVN